MDRAPTELSQALAEASQATGTEELTGDRSAVAELAQLRKTHELLVSALDAASDGILTLRYSDGSFYYNIRFVELWGIPEDRLGDLNQAAVTEFLLSRARYPADYAKLIEQHRLNPEAENLSTIELRDGRVLERHAMPQRIHGQCVGSMITFRDITAKKLAEQEERRQQATLKSLLNSIPDRIFYKDLAGRYLGCNAAFASAIGRPAEEIVGLTAHDLYPEEVANNMLALQKEAQAQLKELSKEYWVTYPDGRRVPFETKISPLWDEDGRSRGLIGISRNISERKQVEEEGVRARAAAEDATRMKSEFLANMSHEIRTPMNAIIGLSNLALKTELTAVQRDYIANVQGAGKHLLGLINDILDFSKVEAGKLDLEQRDFELEELLDNTANLIGEKCNAKGLELVFEVAPDVPDNLVGDSLRLGQILVNYANNAVKFTEKGEIAISVGASERTDKDVLLHFRVQDTGIGLAPDQIDRLFKSFSQADASITRKFGGTGLGLAISKQLAELMGGQAGVESEQGKGSTFWFSARLGIGAVRRRQLLPSLGLRGRRALVVDDNEHARAVIANMLEGMTFLTSEASSGQAAVDEVRAAAASGHPFDVIFLDWRMPGMDGIETARRIQALELVSPPMLLMVTAHGRGEVLKEAEAAGIRNVLVKPVSASTLFDNTMTALGERRLAPLPAKAIRIVSDLRLAGLRGARILLVEDNDINQLIARALLEEVGLVVEVAGDGKVAVERAQQSPYDLVFMDMQMPVMDGITATREIRKVQGLEHLPIIAMTANAMERDRRMCLDAGMNDFLVKPIDQQELQGLLLRWLRARRQARQSDAARVESPMTSTQPAATPEDKLPEGIAGFDTDLGLGRMLNNKALYLRMLRRYMASQEHVGRDIRLALAAGDKATAERLAHTSKAVSGNIGATLVQDRAAALESAIGDGSGTSEIERLLEDFAGPLAELLGALNSGIGEVENDALGTCHRG